MNPIVRWSILILLPVLAQQSHGLEFSSSVKMEDNGERQREILEFQDRGQVVQYAPPVGWRVRGGGSSLSFVDPEEPTADVELKTGKFAAIAPDGDSVAGAEGSFKRLAYSQIPAGAEEIECSKSDRTGPMIQKEFGVLYEFRYRHQTRRMMVLVVIWNLDHGAEKLIATILEPARRVSDEVSPTAGKLLSSLYSWTSVRTDGQTKR